MRNVLGATVVLFAAFLATTTVHAQSPGTPSAELTSKLKINIPQTLSIPEGYNHREALFGTSPYGGSIQATVYYADDTLCSQSELDRKKTYPQGDSKFETPFILIVDRGDCTFVQKVRNAQHAGAAGVLIADNTCICNDPNCIMGDSEIPCESQEPIMADDGSGSDITVPSFLLYKRDADKFIDHLKSNYPMQVEMSWSMPKPDGRVEYDLWTSPANAVSRSFLQNWKDVAVSLGDRAYFTPHMYIYDGVRAGCHGMNGGNNCFNLCTNGGRYCGTDPDNDLTNGTSGGDVVRESLRQLCIWNIYGAPSGIGTQWWDYVQMHYETCMEQDKFADQSCIEDVYKKAKIDGKRVEMCMQDSGKTDQDVVNNKLDAEIDAQTRRGIVIIPTAFVNTAAIRGALTVNNVFSAICSGYTEGSAPKVCNQCSTCPDVVGCVKKGVCRATSGASSSGGGGGVSFRTFFGSMLILVGGMGVVYAYYLKQSKDEMRHQVRDLLAEYMPLQEDDGPGAGSGMGANGHHFQFPPRENGQVQFT